MHFKFNTNVNTGIENKYMFKNAISKRCYQIKKYLLFIKVSIKMDNHFEHR